METGSRGEGRKEPHPHPREEDPLGGSPLALALPQKSPRPRLSLCPHRAFQILSDTPTLLADSVTPHDEFSVSAPAFFSGFPPDRGPISMRKVGQCLGPSQATCSCGRKLTHDNESGSNTSTGRVHRPTALSLTHANPALTRGWTAAPPTLAPQGSRNPRNYRPSQIRKGGLPFLDGRWTGAL